MGMEVDKTPYVPSQPQTAAPTAHTVVSDDATNMPIHAVDDMMAIQATKGIPTARVAVVPNSPSPIADKIHNAKHHVQLSLVSPMPQEVLDALKAAVKRGVRVEVLYADKNATLYHLHQAKREIHLRSSGLLLNPEVRQAIHEAEARGVKVHIFDNGDIQHQLMELLGAGAIARPERPGYDRLSTVPTDVARSQPVDVIVDQ